MLETTRSDLYEQGFLLKSTVIYTSNEKKNGEYF